MNLNGVLFFRTLCDSSIATVDSASVVGVVVDGRDSLNTEH